MKLSLKRNNNSFQISRTDDWFAYTGDEKILDVTGMSGLCTSSFSSKELLATSLNQISNTITLHSGNYELSCKTDADREVLSDSNFSSTYWTVSASAALEACLRIANKLTGKSKILGNPNTLNANTLFVASINHKYSRSVLYNNMLHPNINPFQNSFLDTLYNINDVASVIIEPWQFSAGCIQLENAQEIASVCKEKNIILISDETFTGYYRTDRKWGFQNLGIEVDMIYSGKGINNGICPVGIACMTQQVADGIKQNYPGGYYDNWNTLCDNPLSVSTVYNSLRTLRKMNRFPLHDYCAKTFNRPINGVGRILSIDLKTESDADCIKNNSVIVKVKNNRLVMTPSYNWNENVFDFFVENTRKLI